jgi:hypothetical protein
MNTTMKKPMLDGWKKQDYDKKYHREFSTTIKFIAKRNKNGRTSIMKN